MIFNNASATVVARACRAALAHNVEVKDAWGMQSRLALKLPMVAAPTMRHGKRAH